METEFEGVARSYTQKYKLSSFGNISKISSNILSSSNETKLEL